jgi:hypothetical protein
MGNLRDKYTDEEWEDLGKQLNKEISKFGNEVNNYMRNKLNEPNPFIKSSSYSIPFFISLEEKIEKLVETTPNDQELGSKIRSLINS